MKKTHFNSMLEISMELRTLNLKRKIKMEEMKLLKHQVKQDLHPLHWMGTIFGLIKKYGVVYMIRKILK